MPVSLPIKEHFVLPEHLIYLDGNSLGPLPKGATSRAQKSLEAEWGQQLIRAWNKSGWMDLPRRIGDRLAPIIGAPTGSVATGDTLSIKVYQALASALKLRPDRHVVLSEQGNFPTDLYMAQGLIDTIDKGHQIMTPGKNEILDHISEDVAVVMLTHVDYRTGEMHDMAEITRLAHAAGAIMIWDLAHSAGAVPLDIAGCNAEFAVGCTYKYLNGGPGAPAFIYVRPDLVESIQPALSGWLGHNDPFAMEPDYRPAMSTERMRVGTPPVIQMAILDQALDIWDEIDIREIRSASIELCDLFISQVELRCPQLTLVSPRNASNRGSQVSFEFSHGYAAIQALADHGVIGDYRDPDVMRFGFTPLYIDQSDVLKSVAIVEQVINQEIWRKPDYQVRSRVT